ncbi:cyclase family protein [Paenibacillus sp. MBLB4367]|uniref:cyclase family protein n=1 Tax=Paenibacillus sp. MBLB4367 TaxID=3384767 RepID=UPI00390814B4
MKIIDLTGMIREGMWNYEKPFPSFRMRPLERVPWVDGDVYAEVFEGMHSQTGTYLETPAHFYGNDGSYSVADVPIGRLVDMPCKVLMLEEREFDRGGPRKLIDAGMLERCAGSPLIEQGDAILVGTGWGRHWMDAHYLEHSPYFTRSAMEWLIARKPFLLGTDFPRWDNLAKSEGFFPAFYEADILMLAPCVNLEKVGRPAVRLTALPLHIPGTSAVPCRAVIMEEGIAGGE